MDNDFNHFTNKQCRYFPCHTDVAEEDFNCLFCYCPLYAMECGGDFKMLDGVKDCSGCTKNHDKHSWKFIVERLRKKGEYKIKFNKVIT